MARSRPAKALGRFSRFLMILPGLAIVSLLAWGLADLIWKSFHSYDSYLNREGRVSFDQYHEFFFGANASFYRGVFVRTIWLSALVTVTSALLAIPVAYFVVRTQSRLARMVALSLTLVPFLMGEVVRAFGWVLILGRNGVVAWLTASLGGENVSLIGTVLGVWLGGLQTMIPIAVLILMPAVRRVEPDLERAAQTLGARPSRVWWKVVFPLIQPGLIAAAVVVFALTMTEYAIPDMLGAGVLPFAANAIQGVFFFQGNIYLGSALAVILLVVVVIAVILVLLGGRNRGAVRVSPERTAGGAE